MKEPSAATRQESTLEDTDEFLDLLGEHAAREEQTKRRRLWLVAGGGLVYTLLCGWLAGPWLTLLLVGTPLTITGLVLWFRRSSGLGVVPRRVSGPLVVLGIVMLAAGTFLALRPGSSPAFASPDPNAPAIVPNATPAPLAPPPPPATPAPPATPEPAPPPAEEAPVDEAPVEEAPVDPAPPVENPGPPPVENPAPPPPVANPEPPPVEQPPPVEEPPVDEPPVDQPPLVEEPPPEVPDPGMSQPIDPIPPEDPSPDTGIY